MKNKVLIFCLLFCLLGVVGCGSSVEESLAEGLVASLKGSPVSLVEFQEYLEFSMPSGEEELEDEEETLGQVRSRIFDDFIDERLLEMESHVRYDGDPDPLERLFAEIAQEALLKDPVTPEQVQAFLTDRLAQGEGIRALLLRSLMFDVEATAKKIYMNVRRDRMTFEEAAATQETTPGQSAPFSTTLSSLPDEVQEAIGSLKPGWVSTPVEVHGSFYLFVVEEWTTQENSLDDPEWQAEAAAVIRSRRIQAATTRLVRDLRKKTGIVIDPARLPFEYVPESPVQVE